MAIFVHSTEIDTQHPHSHRRRSMELSQEIQDILQKYRPHNRSKPSHADDDLIDVSKIDFSNDQTWLLDCDSVTGTVDLSEFLAYDTDISTSRPFIRPKTRTNRCKVEKCSDLPIGVMPTRQMPSISDEIDNYLSISSRCSADVEKPLHFDLSQPINTSIFDKMLANTSDMDSFQNMSPPSLVNSLCSSTFTNLMENSYIKNDPVLREIRDADYSSVIYPEAEPPLYESITESCSSINTEVAETFVRKTLNSLNCSLNKSVLKHAENIDPNVTYAAMNGTYRKHKHVQQKISNELISSPASAKNVHSCDNDAKQTHKNSLNNTYVRDASKSRTSLLIKSPSDKGSISLQTKIDNYLADTQIQTMSDELDDYMSAKLTKLYGTEEKSLTQYSAESTDSLDRLSSISNSSKDSKLMAEVDAIVERQERSLSLEVMSTPKPSRAVNRLFDNVHISPIPLLKMKEHLSDSEISSEDFHSVRPSLCEQPTTRNFHSLSNLKYADAGNRPRSVITNMRKLSLAKPSSASNLRSNSKIIGSYTNLKTLGTNAKGSYTNLRPRSMVLPNISLKGAYEEDVKCEEFKVPALPTQYVYDSVSCNTNTTFVKPKSSNLPRTSTTGIPRPASRIPGPRSSRLPLSKTKTTSRTELNDEYY